MDKRVLRLKLFEIIQANRERYGVIEEEELAYELSKLFGLDD